MEIVEVEFRLSRDPRSGLRAGKDDLLGARLWHEGNEPSQRTNDMGADQIDSTG